MKKFITQPAGNDRVLVFEEGHAADARPVAGPLTPAEAEAWIQRESAERLIEAGGHFNKTHDAKGRFSSGGGAGGAGGSSGSEASSGGGERVKKAEEDAAAASKAEAAARRELATYTGSDSATAKRLENQYERAKINHSQAKARLEQAKRPQQQKLGGTYKKLPDGGVEWVPDREVLIVPGQAYLLEAPQADMLKQARSHLDAAIKLHQAHMNGAESADEASQKVLMDHIKAAYAALGMKMKQSPSVGGMTPGKMSKAAMSEAIRVLEREFTAKQRKGLAKKGMAMPDGSYPIENQGDLENAIQAAGRAKDYDATKAHIVKRAKALGLAKLLPKDWEGSTQESLAEAMSTDAKLRVVRDEFRAAFNPKGDGVSTPDGMQKAYCYPEEVYLEDGYLVCELAGKYYRVDFTLNARRSAVGEPAYKFAEQKDWKLVEKGDWQMVSEATRTAYFSEPVSLLEATIDDEHMAVRGVTLIKAGFSRNRDKAGRPRYYSPAMLKEKGVPALDGALIHVNHPARSEEADRPEGDAMGVRGWYENVRWDEAAQAVKGDQVLIDRASTRDELWPIVKEATTRKPDLVQLSINALGHSKVGRIENREAIIIESIVKGEHPNRVDIVTRGAAGGSFAGAVLASDGDELTRDLLAALTFEEWRESRPEYRERLMREWQTPRDTGALKETKTKLVEARQKLDDANKRLAELESAGRAEKAELMQLRKEKSADRLLASSGLPRDLRKAIRVELLAQDGEQAMEAVVAREKAKFAASPRPPVPVTGSGQRPPGQPVQEPARARHPVLEALGVADSDALPHSFETAEEWMARTGKRAP